MSARKRSRPKVKERFQKLATDLLSLEVNTIVTHDMIAARKVPELAHTLLDIATTYARQLDEVYGVAKYEGAPVDQQGRPIPNPRSLATTKGEVTFEAQPLDVRTVARLDAKTFRDINITAERALADPGSNQTRSLSSASQAIITRIRDSSMELAIILERLHLDEGAGHGPLEKTKSGLDALARDGKSIELDVSEHERLRIQKIWELGVETIMMQTIIQLDGDVITRLQADYASPEYTHLWQAHQSSVSAAIESWQYLVETVGRLSAALIRIIRGGR